MDTLRKRQDEATSDETLEDLDDDGSVETDDADENNGFSPDGEFDEEDELEDADPL